MTALDTLFLDTRSIDDMPFGAETPEVDRAAVAERVRKQLVTYGVKTADDINRLGCTGAMSFEAAMPGFAPLEDADDKSEARARIQFLRLGLAGGGVGLPCFVTPDRFCLVHATIGGLQENQKQLYPAFVDAISRPLTDPERGQFALINAARMTARTDPDAAADLLSGRTEAPGVIERGEDNGLDDEDVRILHGARLGAQTWKCSDHATTNWACRYCVAQAIVEGPLDTAFVINEQLTPQADAFDTTPMSAEGVVIRLEHANSAGIETLTLYTRVAVFTKKLTR